jgi:hypothetical protein
VAGREAVEESEPVAGTGCWVVSGEPDDGSVVAGGGLDAWLSLSGADPASVAPETGAGAEDWLPVSTAEAGVLAACVPEV